jgi:hypothetical protein
LPILSVTMAKCGTVQLPVMSGAPAYVVAMIGFPIVVIWASVTAFPESVVKLGLTDADEVVAGVDPVEAVSSGGDVRLMLASALDNPAGEHPTKSGAVSFTAAHSALLNWIAAGRSQNSQYHTIRGDSLACSAELHELYRQHDNEATYVELEQRHPISITEHDVWVDVEFDRHCCYFPSALVLPGRDSMHHPQRTREGLLPQ